MMWLSLGLAAVILLSFCPPRSASLRAWAEQVGALLGGPGPAEPTRLAPGAWASSPEVPLAPPPRVLHADPPGLASPPRPAPVVAARPSPAHPPPFEATAPLPVLPGAPELEPRTVRNLPPYPQAEAQAPGLVPIVTAPLAPLPPVSDGSDLRTVRHLPLAGPPPPAIAPVRLPEAAAVPRKTPAAPPAYQASYQAQEAAAPTRVVLPSPGGKKKP